MPCHVKFSAAPFYSLAFQQNQFPLITSLELLLDEEDELKRDIKLTLTSDPKLFNEVDWQLDCLEPG